MPYFLVLLFYNRRKLMRGANVEKTGRSGFLQKLPSDDEIERVNKYQSQLQLITGWLLLGDEMIGFELLTSAARLGVDFKDFSFAICNPNDGINERTQFNRWNQFLKLSFPTLDEIAPQLQKQEDGSYLLSAHAVCVSVLYSTSSKKLVRGISVAILLLCTSYAFLPMAMHIGKSWESNWTYIYFVTSVYLDAIYLCKYITL
jgi:hypothetical protein